MYVAYNEFDKMSVDVLVGGGIAKIGLTSAGGDQGVVPAGGSAYMLGFDSSGRIGSLTANGSSFRNILDDGQGNIGVTGNTTVGGTLGVTGAATLSDTLAVTGNATVGGTLGVTGAINNTIATASLAGTTAGSIEYAMPDQGTVKKFAAAVLGYENDTTTNQTITFPVAFVNPPGVTGNTSGLTVSASTTELTITAPDAVTVYNGVIVVEGI